MSYGRHAQYDLRKFGFGIVRSKADWSGLISFYTVNGKVFSENAFESLLISVMHKNGITDRNSLRFN
jgi:hypothetical protein